MLGEQHNFSFLAGQEATRNDYNSYYLYSPEVDPDIPYPTTSSSGNDDGDYRSQHIPCCRFLELPIMTYARKYFFKVHLRTDGSSRFGKDTKWGTFYPVGAAWVISQESFMESVPVLDVLKLRASYGINGTDNIG